MHHCGKGAAMSDSDNHSATNNHADKTFSSWQGNVTHMPPPPVEVPPAQQSPEKDASNTPGEASSAADGADAPDRTRVIGIAPTDAPPAPDEAPASPAPDTYTNESDSYKTQVIDNAPAPDGTAKSSNITLTLNKKTIAVVAAVVAAFAVGGIALAGALSGSSSAEPDNAPQPASTLEASERDNSETSAASTSTGSDPIPAARLDIADDKIYWARDEHLLCADIDNGELDRMEQLIEFDDSIELVAEQDGNLYVNSGDDIWLVDLETSPDEATKIIDADSFDYFWLVEDGIVYQADDDLVLADAEGDNPETLASDIANFGLDKTSAYAIDENGEIEMIDLANGDSEHIGTVAVDSSFAYADGTAYVLGNDQELMRIRDGEIVDAGLQFAIGDPSKVIFYEGDIYYESTMGNEFCHSDDDADEDLGTAIFRGEPYGRIEGSYLYYTINGDDITVVDIDHDFDYEEFDVEIDDANTDDDSSSSGISSSSDSNRSSNSSGNTTDDPDEATPDRPFVGSTTEDIYDIAEAIEMHSTGGTTVLTTSHFTLPLGATDGMGGEWTVYPNSTLTIEFYCTEARNSGQNGLVFTLAAYDWGDNSYTEIPTAQVAGTSEDKKFVVWMPTDLQYDSSDSSQQRLYQDMRNFAESLDMNGNPDGNPFTVLDP